MLIPERSTVSIALETGELDFSADFASADLHRLAAMDHLQLKSQMVRVYDYMILNNSRAPFNDVRVRQALNYAIDRQAIIDVVYEGFGMPGNTIINNLIFGYTETPGWDHNPERARELLAEAGYPGGEGFPLTPLYVFSDSVRIAQVVQQNLREVGLDLPIEELDISLLFHYIETGLTDIAFMGIGLGSDAAEYATMLQQGGGFNWAFYDNPEMDALFAQAAAIADPAARLAIYERIWNMYQEEAPYAVLVYHYATIMASVDIDLSGAEVFGFYGSTNILPQFLRWR